MQKSQADFFGKLACRPGVGLRTAPNASKRLKTASERLETASERLKTAQNSLRTAQKGSERLRTASERLKAAQNCLGKAQNASKQPQNGSERIKQLQNGAEVTQQLHLKICRSLSAWAIRVLNQSRLKALQHGGPRTE